jgi:hypothetical protein
MNTRLIYRKCAGRSCRNLLEGSVSDRAAASALLRVVAAASDQRFAAKSIVSASDTAAGDIDGTGHELIVGAPATNLNFGTFGGEFE